MAKTKSEAERLLGIWEQGVDWKTRTIYIVGAIEEQALRLIPIIRLLDESKGLIKVFVSSPGGEETTGFAIFDTLRMCRNQVETHGFGGVYSIAALIFQAGNVRYLAPNADLMMHNGSLKIGTEGYMDTDKLERLGREAIVNNARYHNAIADRCELEKSVVAGWCREETHFSAEHAVDNGLADRLIEPEDI